MGLTLTLDGTGESLDMYSMVSWTNPRAQRPCAARWPFTRYCDCQYCMVCISIKGAWGKHKIAH